MGASSALPAPRAHVTGNSGIPHRDTEGHSPWAAGQRGTRKTGRLGPTNRVVGLLYALCAL